MTTTPTPPPVAGPQHGAYDGGPRVSGDQMRDLTRLRRSSTDKHVAGLAGGLGRHVDVDPVIIRVLFVVLTFFGGAGVLAYALGWLLVPKDNTDRAVVDLDGRSRTVALIGVGVLAGLLLLGDLLGNFGWFPWPLLLVGLLVWLVVSNRDQRRARREARDQGWLPPSGYAYGDQTTQTAQTTQAPQTAQTTPVPTTSPAPAAPGVPVDPHAGEHSITSSAAATGPAPAPAGPYSPGWTPSYRRRPRNPKKRGPILFWFTLALIALTIGTLGVIDLAVGGISDAAYPASALAIIAGMLIVGAFYGRAGGLILLGLIAAVVTAGTTAASKFDGDQIAVSPTSGASLKSSYQVDAGELDLDLSQIRDVDELDGRTLDLNVDFGRIEVTVPDGVDVRVASTVDGGGNIEVFGEQHDGWSFKRTTNLDGGQDVPELTIDATVDMGEIVVVSR